MLVTKSAISALRAGTFRAKHTNRLSLSVRQKKTTMTKAPTISRKLMAAKGLFVLFFVMLLAVSCIGQSVGENLSFLLSLLLLAGVAPLFSLSADPMRPLLARYLAWALIHVGFLIFYVYVACRVFSRLSENYVTILYAIAGLGGIIYAFVSAAHFGNIRAVGNQK